jgi:peptidoglycan hydrolase CwlO-like protein
MMKKLIVTAVLAGMMLTTASVFAQGAPTSTSDQEAKHMQQMQADMQQMQAYLKQMQAQMDKIRQTQDPEERHRLMQEHIKSMQEGMQIIHKMSGGALEQRVNVMEMMMDQMLEQQKALTDERRHGFNR